LLPNGKVAVFTAKRADVLLLYWPIQEANDGVNWRGIAATSDVVSTRWASSSLATRTHPWFQSCSTALLR